MRILILSRLFSPRRKLQGNSNDRRCRASSFCANSLFLSVIVEYLDGGTKREPLPVGHVGKRHPEEPVGAHNSAPCAESKRVVATVGEYVGDVTHFAGTRHKGRLPRGVVTA